MCIRDSFYAMDRDKRWDRNKLAWDAIVLGRGEQCTCSPSEYVEQCYACLLYTSRCV